MPFPAKDPNAPPRPRKVWGPNKSRKYAVWYASREKGGADEANWRVGEFRAQHAKGLHNAIARKLRVDLGRPELRGSDVLIMEAHLLPPRTTLEKYLAMLDPDAEE